DRRKQGEEIQLNVLAGLIQVVCSSNLRRQYLAEFVACLFQDEVIRDHPGAVKDAVKPPTLVLNAGDQSIDLIRIAEVHLPITQPTVTRGQSVQERSFFGAKRRAPRQHYPRLAGLREDLPGEENAQAAETSGNQVNTVIFERDRRLFLV